MRTASALILGSAALLQSSHFASAQAAQAVGIENCDSYVEFGTTTSLCSANGVKDTLPEVCAGKTFCTFEECCKPATCDLFSIDGETTLFSISTSKCRTAEITSPEEQNCADDGVCTHQLCCVPAQCDTFYDNESPAVNLCPVVGDFKTDSDTCTTADDGYCTTDDCCTTRACGDGTYSCSYGTLNSESCGTDGCTDEECCDMVTCGTAPWVCTNGGVIDDSATCGTDGTCSNEECCPFLIPDPTCAEEIYSCATGTARIDSNICIGGTCTQLLCCSTITQSTITEARMMRTPRSRISGTQYGA